MPNADEVFRDHVRFTGDGQPDEPVGAPLPIGDPRSGVFNFDKYLAREWAKDLERRIGGMPEQDLNAAKQALSLINRFYGQSEVRAGQPGNISALEPTGATLGNANIAYGSAFENGGVISAAHFRTQVAGTVYIRSWRKVGDAFTLFDEAVVAATAGFQSHNIMVAIPVGGYVGFQGGGVLSIGGTPISSYAGGSASTPSFTDTTASNFSVIVGLDISAYNPLYDTLEDIAGASLAGGLQAIADTLITRETVQVGQSADLSTATPGAGMAAANIAYASAFPHGGRITAIDLRAVAAGQVIARSWRKSGDDFVLHAEQSVNAPTAGVHRLSVDVEVPPGGYVGVNGAGVVAIGGASATVYAGGSAAAPNFTDATTGGLAFLVRLDVERPMVNSGAASSAPAVAYQFVPQTGQSNTVGAAAAITTVQRYNALGFENRGASILPLRAPDVGGFEYPGFGAAEMLRDLIMFAGGPVANRSGDKIVMGRSAKGGTPLSELGRGSPEYAAMIAQAQAVKDVADTLTIPGNMWFQAEADIAAGTVSDYGSRLVTLAQHVDADLREVSGQAKPIPTFAVQITSGAGYKSDGTEWTLPNQQIAAADASPLVQIVSPEYMVPFLDDRHLTAAGARIIGAYQAVALDYWMRTGKPFEAMRIVDSYRSGNTIVLIYNRAGLVLDTTLVPAQANSGFSVVNSAGTAQTVSSVTVARNRVTLTTGGTPAANWKVRYGRSPATGKAPYAGGAGNLRDTSDLTFDGTPLHNWALLQEWTV